MSEEVPESRPYVQTDDRAKDDLLKQPERVNRFLLDAMINTPPRVDGGADEYSEEDPNAPKVAEVWITPLYGSWDLRWRVTVE